MERFYYALTWTCRFPVSGDTCYFAHCYPYTYTDLKAGHTHTDTHCRLIIHIRMYVHICSG